MKSFEGRKILSLQYCASAITKTVNLHKFVQIFLLSASLILCPA